MPNPPEKHDQNAERKNVGLPAVMESPGGGREDGRGNARLPVRVDLSEGAGVDSLAAWLEAYFAVEVTTAPSSRAVQRRDLNRFLDFLIQEEGSDDRARWTARLSRAFLDALRSELTEEGRRRSSDRTIARVTAHLKTFSKWIHRLRPFRLGDPTQKLRGVTPGPGLEIERALTKSERRQLLDAADHLPMVSGRSRDRRRCKDIEFPDERPRRKGARPWRNRAIVYCLVTTGMRRAAVCHLDLSEIDFDKHTVSVREKGGSVHRYKIGREGVKAIHDYLNEERGEDAETFSASPALFLPAAVNTHSRGRLVPGVINTIWNDACQCRTPDMLFIS